MRRLLATIAFTTAIFTPAVVVSAQGAAAHNVASMHQNAVGALAVPQQAAPAPAALVRADVAGIQPAHDNAPLRVNSAASSGLHQGQGVALMAVGGAGLVAGLLIGDDAGTAVALGGLAVGLVGLYQYVR